MTRILVSGASGFLGLPVLEALAREEQEIHALDVRADPPSVPGVCWHRLDMADREAVTQLMGEVAPERLIHLAWCTEHGRFWRAPENLDWVANSLHLLRSFARHGGRRLVMLGSCAEYEWSTAAGPLVESSSPLAPATLYGVAKDALRRVAGAYAEQEGIELAWGRLFLLYGPREAGGRLVPSVIRSLLEGQPVDVGSSKQIRDFMYVHDAAGAIVALLNSSAVGAVNIASGRGTSLGEVIEAIVQSTGRGGLVRRGALPPRPGEPPSLLADVARLRDEVGFRPRWTLADGLAATVRWWQEHGAQADGRSPTTSQPEGRGAEPSRS